ncbi:Uncharacterised protein [Mycobacteroides abscessus subsp. abscessus]|nr:Uncharacterised protein [Mycobacteroides abscessus subsp. abscessus]
MAAIRSRASERLRCWERCSEASTISTVPLKRGPSTRTSRPRWVSVKVVEAAMSKLSWTRLSVVFTP